METDRVKSWLVEHGLGGCACGICIKMAVAKNTLKARVANYFGVANDRLPPGQKEVKKFPVFDRGMHPSFDPETWYFKVYGEVQNPVTWSWDEFQKLPKREQTTDFHCATSWSRLDVNWGGVPLRSIADIVRPTKRAHFVIAECAEGYRTSIPLEKSLDDDVFLAYELDGMPLPINHGGPMRLVVPKLWAYKSAKFLQSLKFSEKDELGTWESSGYNNAAEPWTGKRYAEQ